MNTITVREYARLTTDPLQAPSLDQVSISTADFDELCALNEHRGEGEASLLHQESRTSLRLRQYVGVLETRSGTRIEILPKTCEEKTDAGEVAQRERDLLRRMLMAALDVSAHEGPPSAIERFRAPLFEWIIRRFLLELHTLLKRGLALSYERVAEERPFLRGSLDVGRQLVQPPQRRHLFHVRHDVFSANRPEHRLFRKALDQCLDATRDTENLRLAAPLRGILADIPPSATVTADFRQWNSGRHMAHYQSVRPWCELVLGEHMPFALAGEWRGLSMLFPMEKLFEAHVAACLRRQLRPGAALAAQASGMSLCRLGDASFFALRPDILIRCESTSYLLDTKWKKLSGSLSARFGISQHDVYQLFAYGHKYLQGIGDMALIYPMHHDFPTLEDPFLFSDTLRLWVAGWDLAKDHLVVPADCPLRALFKESPYILQNDLTNLPAV